MTETIKHSILFVDDEEAILRSLNRLFRKEGYHILTAQSGEAGLQTLKEHNGQIAVIVSDQKMPKMDGAAFLEKAKALCPDAIRILLTGYSDMNAIISAVNKGEIHRYLTKPWNDDELVLYVKKAVEQFDLIEENKRLMKTIKRQNKQLYDFGKNMEIKIEERSREIMEQNKTLEFLNKELEIGFYNTIRAFASLTEMAHPFMKGHGKRVSSLAVDMARQMKLSDDDIIHIEIAAILHDIGTITYSAELMTKYRNNRFSKDDKEIYKRHPVEGQSILSFINRLDGVGILIRHHHERYDGSGFPDKLFESGIPVGSRIIAVANTYDWLTEITNLKKTAFLDEYLKDQNITRDLLTDEELVKQAAVHHIKQHAFKKFDPDIVKIFVDVLKEKGIELAREKKVPFSDLKAGMCLTRSIYTLSGRFILPHKTELTDDILSKIKTILGNCEIQDAFYIVHK